MKKKPPILQERHVRDLQLSIIGSVAARASHVLWRPLAAGGVASRDTCIFKARLCHRLQKGIGEGHEKWKLGLGWILVWRTRTFDVSMSSFSGIV